jgi:hypothetical protein
MRPNKYILAALAIIILGAAVVFLNPKSEQKQPDQPVSINSYEECIAAGNPSLESYPAQCKTGDGKSFTQDIGNEMEKTELIRVNNPRPNQTISSPLEITGEARGGWYFEADFPAKLVDANGKVLANIPVTAQSEWMTNNFVPFKATMNFPQPETSTGKLILEKDNPSGLPENADQLIIPVAFAKSGQQTSVKVFFNSSKENAECEKVIAVNRTIQSTAAIATAALNELLKGPSEEEKRNGYSTSINPNVRINSLKIENGTAIADFNQELNRNVAGSCRVMAIRAQITETLKQFPTVQNVKILVNNQSEGILEP